VNNTIGYDNVTVKNCVIYEGSFTTNSAHAISFTASNDSVIEDNTINTISNNSNGLFVDNSQNLTVTSNTIVKNGSTTYGVFVDDSDNMTFSYNNVSAIGKGTYAVRFDNSYNVTASGNEVNTTANQSWGMFAYWCDNSTFSNNIITTLGNNSPALTIQLSADGLMSNNTITTIGIDSYGLDLYADNERNVLLNNNISTDGSYAIYTSNPDNSYINYLIYNNSFGEITWTNTSDDAFLKNIRVNGSIGLGNNLFIGDNVLALNLSAFDGSLIDSSANITLTGLVFDDVNKIFKLDDYSTDSAYVRSNGEDCIGTSCAVISYGSGNLLFNATVLGSFAASDTDCDYTLSACKDSGWVEGGYYCLDQDVADTDDCMVVTNNSVTLDCQGFIMDGDRGGGDYGVQINGYDSLTVTNCSINEFYMGVRLDNSADSIIEYSNLTNNSYSGIYANNADNIVVYDNIMTDNDDSDGSAVHITTSTDNCNVSYNNMTANERGIDYRGSAVGCVFEWNVIDDSDESGIILYGGDNATFRYNNLSGNVYGVRPYDAGSNYNVFYDNQVNASGTYAFYFNADNAMDNWFVNNTVNEHVYYHCYDNSSWNLSDVEILDAKVSNFGSVNMYYCNDSVLSNVSVENNVADGIYMSYSLNITVNDSEIVNVTRDGVSFSYSGNVTVNNITIFNVTQDGVQCSNSDNVTFVGSNISLHNGDGIEMSGSA
jgi:parallel beta-helix repeat protein